MRRAAAGYSPIKGAAQLDDGSTQAGQHSLAAGKSLTTVLCSCVNKDFGVQTPLMLLNFWQSVLRFLLALILIPTGG